MAGLQAVGDGDQFSSVTTRDMKLNPHPPFHPLLGLFNLSIIDVVRLVVFQCNNRKQNIYESTTLLLRLHAHTPTRSSDLWKSVIMVQTFYFRVLNVDGRDQAQSQSDNTQGGCQKINTDINTFGISINVKEESGEYGNCIIKESLFRRPPSPQRIIFYYLISPQSDEFHWLLIDSLM